MHRNLDRHPESLSGSGSLPHTLNELIDECKGVQQGWARTLSSAATLILGMFQVVERTDANARNLDSVEHALMVLISMLQRAKRLKQTQNTGVARTFNQIAFSLNAFRDELYFGQEKSLQCPGKNLFVLDECPLRDDLQTELRDVQVGCTEVERLLTPVSQRSSIFAANGSTLESMGSVFTRNTGRGSLNLFSSTVKSQQGSIGCRNHLSDASSDSSGQHGRIFAQGDVLCDNKGIGFFSFRGAVIMCSNGSVMCLNRGGNH